MLSRNWFLASTLEEIILCILGQKRRHCAEKIYTKYQKLFVNNFFLSYYWYGGEKYVPMKTKECVICGHKNNIVNAAPVPPLKPIPVTPKIFWRVHVDLTTKLPTTENGNKFIALAVCAFSKYIEAKGNVPIFYKHFIVYIGRDVLIQISHNTGGEGGVLPPSGQIGSAKRKFCDFFCIWGAILEKVQLNSHFWMKLIVSGHILEVQKRKTNKKCFLKMLIWLQTFEKVCVTIRNPYSVALWRYPLSVVSWFIVSDWE